MHVEDEHRSQGRLALVATQPRGRSGSWGELAIRRERRGDAIVLRLTGTLDQATSALLQRELDTQATHPKRLLLDVTGLESVDAHGLDALTRARRQARASEAQFSIERGRDAGGEVCYVPLATAPPLDPAA